MLYSYCKHCNAESVGIACQGCGKKIPVSAQCDRWSISTTPAADMRIWKSAVLKLLISVLILFALIFGLEALMAGTDKALRLWNSSLPAVIISLFIAGLAVVLAALLLQGHETVVYRLDVAGAHLQTWHEPGFIKSWARMQERAKDRDYQQSDGSVMHLAQERHLLWRDVQDVKYLKHQSTILLYHTVSVAPMVIRVPDSEEYELAVAFVSKYSKKKSSKK